MSSIRKRLQILVFAGLTLAALTASAQANPVLDFKTGLADEGGLVQLFSDGSLSGTGIPIGKLTVAGAPGGNGGYRVGGSAVDSTPTDDPFGYGSLNFATGGLAGTNFIEIDGFLPGAEMGSAGAPVALMSGTFSDFSLNLDPLTHSGNGLGNAVGWALESPLATLLGLSTDLQYTFLGWSITTDPLSVGTPGTAISTDIRITAVPEPASVMLVGSGLIFVVGSMRRRFNL
jgi:PEP-CTERM motif